MIKESLCLLELLQGIKMIVVLLKKCVKDYKDECLSEKYL